MQLDLYSSPPATGKLQPLSRFLTQRKVFITIDDATEYKRCRVQSNRKGIVLRDLAKGAAINTKKQQVCRPGDFIVAEIDAKVGGYGFIPVELDGAIVSSHYYLFEVDESQLLPRYLHYLAQSDLIQNQISSQGSTNYAAIRSKEFLAIEIPYIEPDQQRKVVTKLDALTQEAEVFNQESAHQATLLTQLRQAVLREAVQGRLVTQEATNEPAHVLLDRIRAGKQQLVKGKKLRADKPLPPLPETEVPPGWAWCRLGEVVSKMDSGWSPACLSTPAQPGFWGVLKTTAVQEMEYRAFENKALPSSLKPKVQYEVEAGDILITRAGPYQRVGVICLVEHSPEKLMISDKIIRFHCVDGLIHPQYIALCIQTGVSKEFLDSKKFGMAESQVNISQDNLRLTPLILPPLPEQQRIVERVTELLVHCTELEAELGQARRVAEAMHAAALREAFTRSSDLVELV